MAKCTLRTGGPRTSCYIRHLHTCDHTCEHTCEYTMEAVVASLAWKISPIMFFFVFNISELNTTFYEASLVVSQKTQRSHVTIAHITITYNTITYNKFVKKNIPWQQNSSLSHFHRSKKHAHAPQIPNTKTPLYTTSTSVITTCKWLFTCLLPPESTTRHRCLYYLGERRWRQHGLRGVKTLPVCMAHHSKPLHHDSDLKRALKRFSYIHTYIYLLTYTLT